MGDAVTGDLGDSYITDQPVSETIQQRVTVTAQLAFMAIGIAVIVAVPLGVLGAYKQAKWQDSTTSALAQVALSIPNFIIGIFLIWLFAVRWDLLPASNWNRLSDGVGDNLQTAILPAIALALGTMAVFSRLIRSDMIATLKEDYILSARSKGLSDRYILFRHALRPSSLSLMTIVGISFGALLGGTVVIETALRHSGPRRLVDRRDQRARHHSDPGHHGLHRRDVHHHQHRGRPAVRRPRPANSEELIVATTEDDVNRRSMARSSAIGR